MAKLSKKQGKTRGKNPREIEYDAFDLEVPENLPKTQAEFMEVTGVKGEVEIVSLLIDGFNASQYSAASDEIGEFIKDEWNKEYQTQFRATIRNYSKMTGQSIEDTVKLLMPAIDAGWVAKKAALAAEAAKVETVTA